MTHVNIQRLLKLEIQDSIPVISHYSSAQLEILQRINHKLCEMKYKPEREVLAHEFDLVQKLDGICGSFSAVHLNQCTT